MPSSSETIAMVTGAFLIGLGPSIPIGSGLMPLLRICACVRVLVNPTGLNSYGSTSYPVFCILRWAYAGFICMFGASLKPIGGSLKVELSVFARFWTTGWPICLPAEFDISLKISG